LISGDRTEGETRIARGKVQRLFVFAVSGARVRPIAYMFCYWAGDVL
jgi:hypothetical protein